MELEEKPAAWLVPRLLEFVSANRVRFSRTEGCTDSDDALKEQMASTVQWHAEIFSDGDGVTDKYGVNHYPVPLYRALTPNVKFSGAAKVGSETGEGGCSASAATEG